MHQKTLHVTCVGVSVSVSAVNHLLTRGARAVVRQTRRDLVRAERLRRGVGCATAARQDPRAAAHRRVQVARATVGGRSRGQRAQSVGQTSRLRGAEKQMTQDERGGKCRNKPDDGQKFSK